MSAQRLDVLMQLAKGIKKFNGFSAEDFLKTNWPAIKSFEKQDIEFFKLRFNQPVENVAQECMSRTRGVM
jgi:hypothetical protein